MVNLAWWRKTRGSCVLYCWKKLRAPKYLQGLVLFIVVVLFPSSTCVGTSKILWQHKKQNRTHHRYKSCQPAAQGRSLSPFFSSKQLSTRSIKTSFKNPCASQKSENPGTTVKGQSNRGEKYRRTKYPPGTIVIRVSNSEYTSTLRVRSYASNY